MCVCFLHRQAQRNPGCFLKIFSKIIEKLAGSWLPFHLTQGGICQPKENQGFSISYFYFFLFYFRHFTNILSFIESEIQAFYWCVCIVGIWTCCPFPTKCKKILHGWHEDRSQLCLYVVWSDRTRLLNIVVIYSMFREFFVFPVKRLHRIHYVQGFPDIWYFVIVCKCQVWIINTVTAKKKP